MTQLIPLMRANWVIALRGLTTITDIDETEAIPHFMLPSLGGGKTLRGFPDFRFRDRHRLVMNAELRWTSRASSTWRSSTTPARWRRGEATSISAIWRTRTGSACGSSV